MNTGEFILTIVKRRIVILLAGLLFAVLLFIYAKTTPGEYTSKATVFPLTSTSDNDIASSTLSNLLGISNAPKSFSSEASINIIELALSRNMREQVASTIVPKFGNKTVTELLVEQKNAHKSFFSKDIEVPQDSTERAALGANLINTDIEAKINKNGVLELYYTSTDSALVKPVSDIIIDKISQFYIDLRIQKALADYTFTLKKIDSIENALNSLDSKAIAYQNSTYFTPDGKLAYDLPKQNLSLQRQRITDQENASINNREEALWRLQKVTPIIATLDKPEPPFDFKKPSSLMYAVVGFIIGIIIATVISISGVTYRYVKSEIKKLAHPETASATTSTADRL